MTLRDRLAAALARTGIDVLPGDLPGDVAAAGPGTPAAVLVAVVDRPAPGLLLTRRTETLRRHAGQVAFPGGRVDPGDADAVAAALREADEEIALPPHAVDVVGTLDPYRTVTGFAVVPVVGIVPPDLPLVAQEAEVADIFEVPLDYVLDSANHVAAQAEYGGHTRHFTEIPWQNQRIWGATAAILVNFARRWAHG